MCWLLGLKLGLEAGEDSFRIKSRQAHDVDDDDDDDDGGGSEVQPRVTARGSSFCLHHKAADPVRVTGDT